MSTAKRLVLSLRGRKQSVQQDASSVASRLVGPGGGGPPGGYGSAGLDCAAHHELDEIAVVSSNADPCHVKYGSGPLGLSTINGPRFVPGKSSSIFVATKKFHAIIY